jgi:RNA 3'-terminal phosphate cyclase (ATP)
MISRLPRHVAERELAVVRAGLGLDEAECEIRDVRHAEGPGNALVIELVFAGGTEVLSAFGRKGRPAEDVAQEAVDAARAFLDAGVPVSPHLADQLLLPMALAGGGAFVTAPPTSHFTTNVDTIQAFLDVAVAARSRPDGAVEVTVRPGRET